MAAQAWKLYTTAIKKIGAGTINLPGAVRCALVGSAGNFATGTLSLFTQITDQVTEANGYSGSGKALASEVWTVSGAAVKFDFADPVWTASGGDINSIKAAVLFMSAAAAADCHLLAYASLTGTAFNLASGNTLTLQVNSAGAFVAANG